MLNNNSLMDEVIPLQFFLSQNYPNPFKEKTVIKYCVAFRTRVQITVYNSDNKLIEKLIDEEKDPGTYEVEFDASTCHSGLDQSFRLVRNLTEGSYNYRLVAGDYKREKKMFLSK